MDFFGYSPTTPVEWLIVAVLAIIAVVAVIALIKGVARKAMGLLITASALGLISAPAWGDALSSIF